MNRSIRLTSACAFLALSLLGSWAAPITAQKKVRGPEFVHPVDLTEDLYHRIKAKMFLPEHEPVIIRATTETADGRLMALTNQYFRFSWEQGVFDVKTSGTGIIAIHMDQESVMSHLSISSPSGISGMTREFRQVVLHPVQ